MIFMLCCVVTCILCISDGFVAWMAAQVPEGILELGQKISKSGSPFPQMDSPSEQEVEMGLTQQKAKNLDAVQ